MDANVARILDANFNRAREAMRVMEDHARFVLNDADLCEQLKVLRHDLGNAIQASAMVTAIFTRDTPGDVGTTIATRDEYERSTTVEVVQAAGKRLSEALRVLEEYGKTFSAEWAARIERLRYRGYEIEKRLAHVISARDRFGRIRLYVLVTESLCRRPWQEVIRSAAEGGADCFQLREKDGGDRELIERACAFCELCHDCEALCLINDRADIAVACGADGVHVGQGDIEVAVARRVVGAQRVVGISTHSLEQAQTAAAQCPDYIALGPMFSTPLKPEHEVVGPSTLAEVRKHTALPLVAIGGIDADNVSQITAGGGACVAVCSAIIAADDPAEAARGIRSQLK